MVDRDRRLSMLISEDEHTMLRALAEKEGLTASDWIRQSIRRAHAEAFPTTKRARTTA
jgi:hypothetical protein